MNYYQLGFYAGHKNVPLHRYIDFPDEPLDLTLYEQGWDAGHKEHLLEVEKNRQQMLEHFDHFKNFRKALS